MKLPKGPAWLYAIVLGAAAYALHQLGLLAESGSAIHNILNSLSFAAGFIAVCCLMLNYTKDGRRIKQNVVDPLYKPNDVEERYWDRETGQRRHAGKESPDDAGPGHVRHPLKQIFEQSDGLYKLLIPVGVVVTLVTLAHPENAVRDLSQDQKGVSGLMHGVLHGDTGEISEGGGLLLQSMGRDIKLMLTIVGVGLVIYLIAVWIQKQRVKKDKYHYEEEE